MLGTIIGASLGVLAAIGANSMNRVRYFYQPWRHVFAAIAFGYLGTKYRSIELSLVDLLNDSREKGGLPPIRRSAIELFRKNQEEGK